MEINNNYNNINFGQKFPTEPLLKMALKIWDFESAKKVYLATSSKFPGHVSYYKRAVELAQQAQKNNPEFAEIVEHLKKFPTQKQQLNQIRKIASEQGNTIDINI